MSEFPELEGASALEIRPGAVYAIQCTRVLFREEAERIKRMFAEETGATVVLLGPELRFVRPDGETE